MVSTTESSPIVSNMVISEVDNVKMEAQKLDSVEDGKHLQGGKAQTKSTVRQKHRHRHQHKQDPSQKLAQQPSVSCDGHVQELVSKGDNVMLEDNVNLETGKPDTETVAKLVQGDKDHSKSATRKRHRPDKHDHGPRSARLQSSAPHDVPVHRVVPKADNVKPEDNVKPAPGPSARKSSSTKEVAACVGAKPKDSV